ncbi:MAG: PIN domain-containing protein [Nanoarchaeota archaeon]
MDELYFFDTYALIEIYKGSNNYERYSKGVNLILNKLNLMEYALFLIREGKESEIQSTFENLNRFNVDYNDDILISAAKMKNKYAKEKLSFVDCIGYLLAKKHNAKFLTGDSKFESKDNVEFVK